jgi:hypothetical protein
VRDPEETHRERPGGRLLARRHRSQIGEVGNLVLVELALQQRERERRAVDLEAAIQVTQQVGQRADVVLVPVGEDDRPDPVGLFANEVEVGEDEIDARHVTVREG